MKKILCLISLLVLTIKSNGQTWAWAKSGDGTGNHEGYSVRVDNVGNIYSCGYFATPSITFGTYTLNSSGAADMFLVKYDPNGNVLWAKNAIGSLPDIAYWVTTDPSGNVFLTGYFNSPTITFGTYTLTNSGNTNVFLAKYDTNGNVIWAKNSIASGNFVNRGLSASTDSSGNIFITGSFASPMITFGSYTLTNTGSSTIFLVKYDGNGNVIWAKSANGTNNNVGNTVSTDALGNVLISGAFQSSILTAGTLTVSNYNPGLEDIFVIKYDSNGNEIWAKRFGGTGPDIGYCIDTRPTGDIFLTGSFSSSTLAIGSFSLGNTGSSDMFISKFDTNGNPIWAKSGAGVGPDVGYCLSTYSAGVFVTGSMGSNGFVSCCGSPITLGSYSLTLPPGSTDPMFIAHYDLNGNVVYASALASGGDDQISVSTDKSCNAYIAGDFLQTNPFIVGSNTLTLTGVENIFTAKLTFSCLVNGIKNNDKILDRVIFPNPNNGTFKLQIENEINNGEFVLINSMGQKVYEQTVREGINNINTGGLAKGLYNYILLQDKQKIKDGKLVVD